MEDFILLCIHLGILLLGDFSLVLLVSEIVYRISVIDEGEVFGIYIPSATKKNLVKPIVLGVIFFSTSSLYLKILFDLLFNNILLFALHATFLIVLFLIVIIGRHKNIVRKSARQKNALILGNLPFIVAIDEQIASCSMFTVEYEKVTITTKDTKTEFPYGFNLTTEQLAMLGLYFLQRHHRLFNLKVIMRLTSFETGRIIGTVTQVGYYKTVSLQNETAITRELDYYQFSRKGKV